jgi:inner membrane protein
MEPVTHMLTGAVLARAGFNRKAAYATAAMAIAAEFPDIDISWSVFGPVTSFLHHRGITHTFVAIPFEAALITGYFWFTHRFRKRPTAAPPNWLWLFLGCWLALGSHILLDWTNNYGVRPFFPFNPRWYAGSFVFIFEPVLFAILLIALIAPWLFGLVGSEVGVRREPFRGRGWAIAAIVGIAALYVLRYTERARAMQIVAADQPDGATRIFASPHPGNPFAWSTVTDTPGFYQLATVDTLRGVVAPSMPSDTLYKPPVSLPILVAKRSYLGRAYLDWSMFPVIAETPAGDPTHPLVEVKFADARFMYDTVLESGKSDPPLTGTVLLDMAAPADDRVVETRMGDRIQRTGK